MLRIYLTNSDYYFGWYLQFSCDFIFDLDISNITRQGSDSEWRTENEDLGISYQLLLLAFIIHILLK